MRLKIKLKDIIMSKGVSFFLGVLVGVALTGAAWFAINNSSSSFGRLTMFDERGQMLDADSFFVVSTEDNYHALAIDSEMLFLLTLSQALNINQPIQQLVYIIGNEKLNFYDGYEIKASDKARFYQVGTYKFKNNNNQWSTVPAVMLMKVH